jgi:hypothetical protein
MKQIWYNRANQTGEPLPISALATTCGRLMALQVATAIAAGCDAFLTNDAGLKRVTEIIILMLDERELDLPKV